MRWNIIIALIILVLAIGLSACTETKKEDPVPVVPPQETPPPQTTPPPTTTPTPPPTATPAEPADPKLKVFHINASNWKFVPNEIRVYKGDKVKIYLTSLDVAHGFAIYEGAYENISLEVPGGETGILEFNATHTGIYTWKCNVYCGAGHSNMKGTFTVYGDPDWD